MNPCVIVSQCWYNNSYYKITAHETETNTSAEVDKLPKGILPLLQVFVFTVKSSFD